MGTYYQFIDSII